MIIVDKNIINEKMKNLFLKLLITLLIVGSAYSTGYFFDSYIFPKWYISINIFLVIISALLIGKNKISIHNYFPFLRVLFTCIIIITDTYCLYDIIQSEIVDTIATYDNIAGVIACICPLLPYTIKTDENLKPQPTKTFILLIITNIILFIILKNRTGILCISITLFYFFYKKNRLSRVKIITVSFVAVSILIIWKIPSSLGRIFIIINTITLIINNPLNFNPNSFREQYMYYQCEYFKHNPNSIFAQYADNTMTSLNEYLNLIANYGIIGLLLLLLTIYCIYIIYEKSRSLYKNQYGLSLFIISIISLVSYPFLYPLTWIILFLDIIGLLIQTKLYEYLIRRNKLSNYSIILILMIIAYLFYATNKRGYYEYKFGEWIDNPKNVNRYSISKLRKYFNNDPEFIFADAMNDFYYKNYKTALFKLYRCDKYWSDYNLNLYIGIANLHLLNYKTALIYLKRAYYMCPNRFKPLYYQVIIYYCNKDYHKCNNLSYYILRKSIKVYSSDIYLIKFNIKQLIKTKNDKTNQEIIYERCLE